MRNVGIVETRLITTHTEIDKRYENNILSLSRMNSHTGCLIKNGSVIESKSLENTPTGFETSFSLNLVNLEETFSQFQITKCIRKKELFLDNVKKFSISNSRYYLKINKDGFIHTKLVSGEKETLGFYKQISDYYRLNESSLNIDIDSIFFSSEAFGYILHESLGHRLEYDDYQTKIDWKTNISPNFNVYDFAGEPDAWGYTPFDDLGTKSTAVCLLNSENLETHFLTRESGNMRVVDYRYHPIVRQRCLINKITEKKKIDCKKSLLIRSVSLGQFENEKVTIKTQMQSVIEGGVEKRLPPLKISFNINEILKMTAFGSVSLSEPAAGCYKNGQNELPISFYTTPAFLKTQGASLKVELAQ